MIDFTRNHFELFGLPERFRFDAALLDRAYHALQSEVHPDRFATAGDAERRVALQSSARVNEAYRALKDPVIRAQYILSLHGVDALSETDTSLPPAASLMPDTTTAPPGSSMSSLDGSGSSSSAEPSASPGASASPAP